MIDQTRLVELIGTMRSCRTVGFCGSVLVAVGGMTAGALPVRMDLVGLEVLHDVRQHSGAGLVCAYVGLTMLVVAWHWFGRALRAPNPPGPRAVIATLLLWGTPLAVAPPLFSRDVYSYLVQGAMVAQHVDVYRHGPADFGGPLAVEVPEIWQHAATPYGPVFLLLASAVVSATGAGGQLGLVGMRLLALAGVGLLAAFVPRLARRCGADPAAALWLGVLNPLLLLHLLGGAHNDAVMLGLLVAGLAMARERPLLATVIVTLAALVKAPAALGLVTIAVMWSARLTGRGPFVRAALPVAAVAMVTAVVVSAVAGFGYGWIGGLRTPITATSWSITSAAGRLTGDVLTAGGLRGAATAVVVWHWMGLVAVAVAGAWVWHRRHVLGPVFASGLVLCALAVLGPATRPWYVLWGLVLMAASAPDGRVRRWVALGCGVLAMVVLPSGSAPGLLQVGQAVLGVALGLALVVPLLVVRGPALAVSAS